MDPLLRQLQASGLGLSANQYYAGGYLHADDIRTLETSVDSAAAASGTGENFGCFSMLPLPRLHHYDIIAIVGLFTYIHIPSIHHICIYTCRSYIA